MNARQKHSLLFIKKGYRYRDAINRSITRRAILLPQANEMIVERDIDEDFICSAVDAQNAMANLRRQEKAFKKRPVYPWNRKKQPRRATPLPFGASASTKRTCRKKYITAMANAWHEE